MRRRNFLQLAGGFAGFATIGSRGSPFSFAAEGGTRPSGKIVGMYIHEGWPYNHPYAARTWTVEDYRGYADGLKRLGYNTLVIWPIVETMPDPPTPSDQASLEKTARVIDMLHREFGMLAYMTLTPNVIANDRESTQYTFEQRPLFSCAEFVDPADPSAVARMIRRRKELLRSLAKMDGIAIIDSDPGGYPGSTNQQFVHLLGEHRKMLDRLRSGIELYYWMHVGWEAYCRYYATGQFGWGTPAEARDILTRLAKINPEPWGITIHTMSVPPNGTDLKLAEQMGLASTALAFNYGAIEGEPSFPLTNYGGDAAYNAGRATAPHGVVGNAQTHCAQLPNTFAFARGSQGLPVEEGDYVEFAEELVVGRGRQIVEAWKTLAGEESQPMREMAENLDNLPHARLKPGALKGLLFGDTDRFISDLSIQLRVRASFEDFVTASEENWSIKKSFREFFQTAETWQKKTGYASLWRWPKLEKALKKLNSPAINTILAETNNESITTQAQGKTPFERVQNFYRQWDSFTPRLFAAMRTALQRM